MEKLRYAVIGTSKITTQYIAAAQSTGMWELCAVYSRTAETGEAFAAQYGVSRVFTDLDAFAQSDAFDAVYVASPNVFHYEHCKQLLNGGKHVICEKPFTSYPWQMQELFAIAREKNLILMEAIMFMHQPAKQALQAAMAKIGAVQMVLFDNCRRSPKYDLLLQGETPNVFNPELHTGALMDMGVYCVYPALALFGRPTSFSVKACVLPLGTDASGVITFEYSDKIVELRYSKAVTSGVDSEILGEEGRISIDSILHASNIVLHKPEQEPITVFEKPTKTQLMANEAVAFAKFITERADTESRVEYLQCKQIALLVCEYLEKIRVAMGLSF